MSSRYFTTHTREASPAPRVYVALATYNGRLYLEQQVNSILDQRDVDVRLVVSDDGSADGTAEWLAQLADRDDRVRLLPRRTGPAGVAANFFYILDSLELRPDDFVAMSDQDDLWQPRKLRQQIDYLRSHEAAATSSNVVSFGAHGKYRLIDKAQPLGKWDFVFEAPGPGSTFLLTADAWRQVTDAFHQLDIADVWLHDWFIYALVRAGGGGWAIDPRPHVAYRQHEGNVLGAHRGLDAVRDRWRNLRSGRYREQFLLTARAARQIGETAGRSRQWLTELDALISVLETPGAKGRLGLLPYVGEMRRKRVDQLTLGAAGLLGVW